MISEIKGMYVMGYLMGMEELSVKESKGGNGKAGSGRS